MGAPSINGAYSGSDRGGAQSFSLVSCGQRLLPLGCAAAPKSHTSHPLNVCGEWVGAASLPSGSKLPRHKGYVVIARRRPRVSSRQHARPVRLAVGWR
ncbi:hypothetical protein E1K68_10905 [Pseudomonas sp. B2021]|nr:hypothetical protein [Pseudomonas sp. B2021]